MPRQIFVNFAVKDLERSKKFFAGRSIADPRKSTEVMTCISCASREEVDTMVAKAKAGGGKAYREATDHGFMYHHGFEDPDGHIWEVVHLKGSR
jgi:predicted lactoylglutathione lyase